MEQRNECPACGEIQLSQDELMRLQSMGHMVSAHSYVPKKGNYQWFSLSSTKFKCITHWMPMPLGPSVQTNVMQSNETTNKRD